MYFTYTHTCTQAPRPAAVPTRASRLGSVNSTPTPERQTCPRGSTCRQRARAPRNSRSMSAPHSVYVHVFKGLYGFMLMGSLCHTGTTGCREWTTVLCSSGEGHKTKRF